MIFGLVNSLYIPVPFLTETMSIADKKTTATVAAAALEVGIHIIPNINEKTKIGGTFSSDFLINCLLLNPTKSKHPNAISQNLVGIKK